MRDKFYEMVISSDNKNLLETLKELIFDLGITCIEEQDNCFIIRDEDEVKFALEAYKKSLENELKCSINFTITSIQKENKDWIDEYKKSVTPILVGDFYIRASWHEEKTHAINIIIDPSFAFGSGHHESTRMSLEGLQDIIKNSKKQQPKLLDVGCGSGILSIVAKKMQASIEACDTDEIAIENSLQNAALNGVVFDKIWCGSVEKAQKKYDIIVVNIIADIILMLKKDLINLLSLDSQDGAYLVLSGITTNRDKDIKKSFSSLNLLDEKEQNGWKSYIYFKKGK